MKKIIYILLFISALFISSCDDENEDTNQQQTSEDSNPQQTDGDNQNPISDDEVTQEIEIIGETNTGVFPSATGQLTFENESEKIDIVPGNSLTIAFETDSMPDGAYAQIVTAEGAPVNDVFFNITNIGTVDFSDTFFTFDVTIGDQISTGTFFIKYAIYQGDNVADSEIVCVTINESISQSDLLGRWELVINDIPESATINCNDGTSIEIVDFIAIEDTFIIEFNENGTYQIENKSTIRDLDFTATTEQCTAVYFPEQSDNDVTKGIWSFNSETSELSLTGTEIDDLIDDSNDEIIPESERDTDKFIVGIRNNGNTLITTSTEEEGTFSSTFNKL